MRRRPRFERLRPIIGNFDHGHNRTTAISYLTRTGRDWGGILLSRVRDLKVAILQIPKKCAEICAYRYARVIPQEENSPWREVSHGKGACAGKSPEGAE